jgi:uncharacterized membrane protein
MSNQHHDIFESRKQFQLERIILFSDAVFAIAITLLIIEIKIPHFEEHPTQQQLSSALLHKLPEFIGFIISFAVIGQFWTNHHRLFGYIKDYTPGLMWLNLLMLFWVVLMPFSTYLNMEFGNLDITWFWYCINLTCIAFSLYLLWKYVGRHKHLCYMAEDTIFMQFAYRRSLIVTAIFLLGALLTLLPWMPVKWSARFVFFLIFPALSILRKRHYKINKKAAVE